MLRLCSSVDPSSRDTVAAACSPSFMELDSRKKQVTIYEPRNPSLSLTEERCLGIAAPKMFAFDNVFSSDDSQSEVCSRVLSDILPVVVNGSDACIFTYGYSKLGKTHSMIGSCDAVDDLGLMPCATWWLFKLIGEQKQRCGSRFSVRVSATEIAGKDEVVRDLLASEAHGTEVAGFSPASYLRDDSKTALGWQLENQCELRAPSAEKAAYYLDAALAARSTAASDSSEPNGISHFLFTFHIYQYRVDKSDKGAAVGGGRSRLYLMDLSGCEKQSQVYLSSRSYRISTANLGNVILAIFNGDKHVPYKDGKLTQVLREILGNVTCRASMLAHVSPSPDQYTESLATIQLASRIHRLRHKKWKNYHSGGGEGLSEDCVGANGRRGDVSVGLRSSSSDFDYTSSDTCDTVIFVGTTPTRENRTIHEEPANEKPSTEPPSPMTNPTTRMGFAQIRRMHEGLVNGHHSRPSPMDELLKHERLRPFLAYRNNLQFAQNIVNAIGLESGMRCDFSTTTTTTSKPIGRRSTSDGVTSSSDEFWVDGPKMSRSRLNGLRRGARTFAPASGHETWVDGPSGVPYTLRYLDDQKRAMIENWIDMQGDVVDDRDGSIVSDTLSDGCGRGNDSADCFARGLSNGPWDPNVVMVGEVDVVSTVDSVVSGDDTEKSDSAAASVTYQEAGLLCSQRENRSSLSDIFREASIGDVSLEAHDAVSEDQCWMSYVPTTTTRDECASQLDGQRYVTDDSFNLEVDEFEEVDGDPLANDEGIDGAGETVYMTDSWVQVSESDLQDVRRRRSHRCTANAYEDHPLRVLSSESLAISFTNSSRVSWDSGLNAVRKAMAAATIMDDGTPFDFGPYSTDARSICSEPAVASSAVAIPMNILHRHLNAFGSKSGSLRDLTDVFGSRSLSTSDYSSCSCEDCHSKGTKDEDSGRPSIRPVGTEVDGAFVNASDEDIRVEASVDYRLTRIFNAVVKKTIGCGRGASVDADLGPVIPVSDDPETNCVCLVPETQNSPLDGSWGEKSIIRCATDVRSELSNRVEVMRPSVDDHPDEDDKDQPSSAATSSGYNSMPRDGEGSVSAVEGDTTSLNSEELLSPIHVASRTILDSDPLRHDDSLFMLSTNRILQDQHRSTSFELLIYDEEDVARMERSRAIEKVLQLRRRCSRIRLLRKKQQLLRQELESTYRFLMVDNSKWSYDPFVEQCLDVDDPAFLEALESETAILEKRVAACKSHLMFVTCFDVTDSDELRRVIEGSDTSAVLPTIITDDKSFVSPQEDSWKT